MKKIIFSLFVILLLSKTQQTFSQTTFFLQSFDTISQGTLPLGWANQLAANPSSIGWGADSASHSSGYAGASGLKNMVIKNQGNSTGVYKLISSSISTLGFSNIALSFASRVSNNFTASGSSTPNLFYSINNGSTWVAVPYTDNAANSTYALVNGGTPISFPIAVNNKSSLKLKWEIQIDTAGSGTYRIDDVNLTGLVCSTTSSVKNDTICNGSTYTFSGNTYTAAGNYTVNFPNYLGCDSNAVLNLVVKQNSTSSTNSGICSGSSYVFNGTTYTAAGNYTHHLTNAIGCDSAATLHLAVYNPTTSTTTASVCTGNSYTFNGNTYTANGNYTVHLLNYHGCDSAATLALTVSSGFTPSVLISTPNTSVCNGSSVTFTAAPSNGGTLPVYQWYKNLSPVGFNQTTYTDNGLNTADIISCKLTSNLTCVNTGTNPATSNSLTMLVNQPSSSSTTAAICAGDSFLFAGNYYKTANTFLVHINNYVSCDSAATLHLTIKQPSTSTTTAAICHGDTYTFNSNNYTSAGNFTIHLTNAVGCDSAATLNLSVNTVDTSASVTSGISVMATQAGATYQWIDCATDLVIANATSQTYTPGVNGNYKCAITINGCSDTTACKSITGNVGVRELKVENEKLKVYPNPADEWLMVNGEWLIGNNTLHVYDLMGREVLNSIIVNHKSEVINVSALKSGFYFIKITGVDGKISTTKFSKL